MSVFNFTTSPFVTFDDIARVFDDALTGHQNSSQIARPQHPNTTFRSKYAPSTSISSDRSITDKLPFRVDVHEGPDNTVVASFELPGLKKEDVSIELHNNQLTVSGEAKSTTTTHSPEGGADGSRYFIRERRFGKFSRTIPLPEGTRPDSVKAAVTDGVLTITYPKATPEQSPKKIDIQ